MSSGGQNGKTHFPSCYAEFLVFAGGIYGEGPEQPAHYGPVTDPEFVAAERVLPAGDYSFTHAASDQTVLIRNNGTQKAVFVMTYVTQTRDRQPVPKLVFHRYGDQYFLREVWGSGTNTGSLLRQPVLERSHRQGLEEAAAGNRNCCGKPQRRES